MSKRLRKRNARHRRRLLNPAQDGHYHKPLGINPSALLEPMLTLHTSRIVHLIYTPFTGMGLHNGFRGEEWFKYRIQIFKDFTLKSLLNQTSKNFVHWISFRKEEVNHPEMLALSQYLQSFNYPFVFTFDGLMYYDDKFSRGLWYRFLNFGRVLRDCWRQKTFKELKGGIKELWIDKNKTLPERLANSLKVLYNKIGEVDWVYLTRIDSDDMFHRDAIKYIQEQPSFKGAYQLKNGYIYNKNTKELCEYLPNVNPPFHTIVFDSQDFFDPNRYLAYFKDFKSHEDIPRIFDVRRLNDMLYCVLIHDKHVSTTWNHPFRGQEVTEGKEEILKDFGI